MAFGIFATGRNAGFLRGGSGQPSDGGLGTESKLKEALAGASDRSTAVLDMYKFYQDRVEELRSRLWTMLIWLAGAEAAILVFIVKELKVSLGVSSQEYFRVEQPALALILSIFGFALATYMMHVIDDGSGHIEANWRRADIVLGKDPPHTIEQNARTRRGNHPVCRVMAEVAGWARITYLVLMLISMVVLVDGWQLYDFPHVG